MDLKDIKAIIDLMKKNSLAEFELERADFKIKLKRGHLAGQNDEVSGHSTALLPVGTMPLPSPLPVTVQPPQGGLPASPPAESSDVEIKSPMIGTFYRAPSPESANYVEIGTEVSPDTVVCIIEAMKVMNEIKAEAKGVVTQILVESAKPVEFGQALFKIRPN